MYVHNWGEAIGVGKRGGGGGETCSTPTYWNDSHTTSKHYK